MCGCARIYYLSQMCIKWNRFSPDSFSSFIFIIIYFCDSPCNLYVALLVHLCLIHNLWLLRSPTTVAQALGIHTRRHRRLYYMIMYECIYNIYKYALNRKQIPRWAAFGVVWGWLVLFFHSGIVVHFFSLRPLLLCVRFGSSLSVYKEIYIYYIQLYNPLPHFIHCKRSFNFSYTQNHIYFHHNHSLIWIYIIPIDRWKSNMMFSRSRQKLHKEREINI